MRKLLPVVSLLIVASMLLAACQTTATPAATAAATEAATATTTRHGGWLDEIVFSVVSSDAVVTQLKAGAIDIYGNALASQDLQTIQDAGLSYAKTAGMYYDIMYNPAVFTDTNTLNPFSDRKIREATNWLYDRNYLNQEIYGGGSLPKFFTIQTNGPDYADLADVARELENYYAYDFDKANQVISDEMKTLGADLNADGKWEFKGKPVVLTFLIRNDSDGTRIPMGDYVANQLEKVGFTVDRQYKKSSEASPIWIGTDPTEGKWNMYTAAWSGTVIDRDARTRFQEMYLPDSLQGMPVFLANKPDPEFQKVGDDLANSNYTDAAARKQLMADALKLSVQDSLQVFLIDGLNYIPYTDKVQVTSDLVAGVAAAQIFPETIRFKDQEGGTLRWGDQDLFAEPWNPIAGSNWTFDQAAIRTTMSFGTMLDPYTGLAWPWRAEKADLEARKDIQIYNNNGWVNLTSADTVTPDDDAWIDWDAGNQKFQTVADAKAAKTVVDAFDASLTTAADGFDVANVSADSLTTFLKDQATAFGTAAKTTLDLDTYLADAANATLISDEVTNISGMADDAAKKAEVVSFVKTTLTAVDPSNTFEMGSMDVTTSKIVSTIYYPADMYDTVVWHDGSKLSAADFVMAMIMNFDRAKVNSPIYDEAAVPVFQSFMQSFKGVKIVSTNPLVIKTWSDSYFADAELDISTWWPSEPTYGYGEAAWDIMSVANLAEANGELAYSPDKSTAKGVDETNFVSGDSLTVLAKYLDQAIADKYVPYANTMGTYVTADDAATRYGNLKTWYQAHNHFWVGTGPYYLDTVSPVEKSLVLKSYSGYADLSDRWSNKFAEPKIADVEITAPDSVKIGSEATFNVAVTFKGEPYPQSEIKAVKYLVYDATGSVILTDFATAVADGQYTVTLPADVTSKLSAGSNKLEVAVVPIPVCSPTFASVQFVTAQ